jgi:hypothetical protein
VAQTTTLPDGSIQYNVTLPSNLPQLDANIRVQKGQTIKAFATGKVNSTPHQSDGAFKWVGPDGWGSDPGFMHQRKGPLKRGQSFMALCMRIGFGNLPVDDGEWHLAGSSFEFVADQDGTVHLTVNDQDYSDNQGEFTVQIQIK